MAKSLGQIHTVSQTFPNNTYSLAAANKLLIDLPGELTRQLQHMCRMMANYKVVGIDMSFAPITNASDVTCSMSGSIQYYAPTAGRVAACKKAYEAVRRMMKIKGIVPSHNLNYDFRPLIANPADFENGADIANQATIEDNGLASCLANSPGGSSNIFGIYNQGIQPRLTVGAATFFEDGFNVGLRTNADSDDFVLNPKALLANAEDPLASEDLEEIPFELSWTPGGVASSGGTPAGISYQAATTSQLQWRPDPALYLSVLTGQLIVNIHESSAVDSAGVDVMDNTELDVAVHVAGWKGILGSNKKRSRRGRKHGRRRTKK